MASAKPVQKSHTQVAPKADLRELVFYLSVLALWGVYVALAYQSSATVVQTRYNLSDTTIGLLRATVAIPYLIIWLMGAGAFVGVRRYTVAIFSSKEAPAFSLILQGIGVLLFGIIASTILSSARSVINVDDPARRAMTIATNYFYVFPYLVAFWLFWRSARQFSRTVKFSLKAGNWVVPLLLFLLFASAWLYLIFTNASRTIAADAASTATYYLPDSLIVATIVIPSLTAWALGVVSIVELYKYSLKVKGILYRQSLTAFVRGLSAVIIGSIILHGFLSLGARRLLELGLGELLIVIYAFVLIQAMGFYFISRGARGLTKIESV